MISDLVSMLREMSPRLCDGTFVFTTVDLADHLDLQVRALFVEDEGLSVVIDGADADARGLAYQGHYRQITLEVHSALDGVGLTAAVATALADANIPANVIAALHHDHVFVPVDRADEALMILQDLQRRNASIASGSK